MRLRALLALGLALLGSAAMSNSLLAAHFNFECRPDRYASAPLETVQYQFIAPISAIAPGNDAVEVIFEPHLPGIWSSQWCHTSTGICYFGDSQISLTAGVLDTLEIDFFPFSILPEKGWIDLEIRSVEDPNDVARCTFTLFLGMPVPEVSYTIDTSDNTRRPGTGPGQADFHTPFINNSGDMDTLLVRMIPDLPGDWTGAQYCQTSTGICYFDRGELPMWGGLAEDLHITVWHGAAPSMGGLDFVFQSKGNPSVAQYGHYRIFVGDLPADAPVSPTTTLSCVAAPNPSSGPTSIRLQNPAGGTGRLTIYGPDGRIVRAFPRLDLGAGSASVAWDGANDHGEPVPPGIYFYRLETEGGAYRGTLVRTR